MQIEVRETIIGKRRHGFTSDAVSPEIFAQPVTKLGAMAMNIFADANADPADGCSADIDAKTGGRLRAHGALQEFIRVVDCVRMRKQIAQPQPDLAIVRILRQ